MTASDPARGVRQSLATVFALGPRHEPTTAARTGTLTWPLLLTIGAVVALSRWLVRAQVPDDFDSIGFLLGMSQKYDLATLQPHFPGYPVYVALGAALCRLGLPALTAATAISSCAAGISAVALALCARRLAGVAAALSVAGLHAVAWMPWLLGSGALSDSLGLALAASAFALLALPLPRLAASGFVAGLLLGARASYWPLVVSLALLVLAWRALGRARIRFFAGLVMGTMLWAVPFLALVGVHPFIELGAAHLRGHFVDWGGSILTRTSPLQRGEAFLSGLFYEGLAPSLVPLAAIALVLIVATVVGRRSRTERPDTSLTVRLALLVLAPYAVWVFVAQNLIDQPRHLLPLVEGGLLVLACLLARQPTAIACVCLLAAWVTLPLAWQRHTLPPAAAQAAEWVVKNENPADSAIVAGRSARFFEEIARAFKLLPRRFFADALADLGRLDRLPATILVTSEVDLHMTRGEEALALSNWRQEEGPHFCRDARIDPLRPCLSFTRLIWSPR